VLVPPHPGKAVTTGAVLFALSPRVIEERCVRGMCHQ